MPRTTVPVFPKLQRKSEDLGDRLRKARLRRQITATAMAERVGISRVTLSRLEEGDTAVSIGNYLKVMRALGLENEIDAIASEDSVGRQLQDAALESPFRASSKPKR